MNLLPLIIAVFLGFCSSSRITEISEAVASILKDFEINRPAPIDLFGLYDTKSVDSAFEYAASRKLIDLMKWLAASASSGPRTIDCALWIPKVPESYCKVAVTAGLYDLALQAIDPLRPNPLFIMRIARTAIKLGVYGEIKGKVPLHCLEYGQIEKLVGLTLKKKACFFDLMDDINKRLLGLYNWGDQKAIQLAEANPKILRYLQIYPIYYSGTTYPQDVADYYKEYKDGEQMVQAVWANLKSIDSKFLDDRQLGIRVKDVVESIPLLGELEYALWSNQPVLIEHALKFHQVLTASTISHLFKERSPGLWYALQDVFFRFSFVEHYSALNMDSNELLCELGNYRYIGKSPGAIRSMEYLGRAFQNSSHTCSHTS